VGDGEGDIGHAHSWGDRGCAAVEPDRGASARLANDLDFEPADSVADLGAQGLCSGFFGGEPGSEAFCGIAFAKTICLLGRRIDTVEEALPKPLHGLLNPGDFDEVDTAADDHAVYQTNTPARRFRMEARTPGCGYSPTFAQLDHHAMGCR